MYNNGFFDPGCDKIRIDQGTIPDNKGGYHMGKIIKNGAELRRRLIDRLRENEIEERPYQIDLYLYLNDDGIAELEDFTNIGGNSWLNDDHYTLCVFREHLDKGYFRDNPEISDLAAAIGMEEDELIGITAKHYDLDTENVRYGDVQHFIAETDRLLIRLIDWYRYYVGEWDFGVIADEILSAFEKETDIVINYSEEAEE